MIERLRTHWLRKIVFAGLVLFVLLFPIVVSSAAPVDTLQPRMYFPIIIGGKSSGVWTETDSLTWRDVWVADTRALAQSRVGCISRLHRLAVPI